MHVRQVVAPFQLRLVSGVLLSLLAVTGASLAEPPPLGLPPVPVPVGNPISSAKVALGAKLFTDTRFSSTGEISCSTCHAPAKAFTDSPLETSEGVHHLSGTRNAPTLANAAYMKRLFWDGRAKDLEDQSRLPLVNPVEMGLHDREPIIQIVRSEPDYVRMFRDAFGKEPAAVGMTEVTQAIATYERTLIFGDSLFDRWYYGGDMRAISEPAQRGFKVFLENGRCVSCHTIEQDFALFTDNRFHNIGIGISRIEKNLPQLGSALLLAKARGVNMDKTVLSSGKTAELGRFALSDTVDDLGAFKTPTLRNVAVTAPYMHDGSLETLRAVVEFYNNGGVIDKGDQPTDYLSGGIRPLDLTEQQITDLIAFLESLTSPQFAALAAQAGTP
jgi:cytochrome c peroxidase